VDKPFPSKFIPTILLPRRKDVETINAREFEKLTEAGKTYKLTRVDPSVLFPATNGINDISSLRRNPEQIEMEYNYLTNSIMAEKEIILKKGTQVMCIANIDMESPEPVVNGSQGIVVDFIGELPLVQFNNGSRRTVGYHVWNSESNLLVGVKQIPLIYAWAITIHKAQGVSLDLAQIDAGNNIFECGQTYVALSRVKSLEGLYLSAFNPQKIKVNRKVQEFYETLKPKPVPAPTLRN
jgi:ATP-dependent DNA helicase PIF1